MPFSENDSNKYFYIGFLPESQVRSCPDTISSDLTPPKYGIISKVEEIVPNKVMRVTFINGDVQKAVCSEEDDFDFERGIEVCICKHYLGGTKEFNRQLRQGLKCWDDACEAEMDRLQEEERIKRKKQKRAVQKQRRDARRELEERERQIEIQTEAILRAKSISKRKRIL